MKLVLAAALVTCLAFAGSRFSFLRLPLARMAGPLGVRNILLTGTEFLFVGLLLAHPAVGVLDEPTLLGLMPVLGMGLSWIGLLFGIQWQIHRFDESARSAFLPAIVQAVVTAVLVGVPFFYVLQAWTGANASWCLVGALALGAAASDTAQSALALVGRSTKGPARHLVRLLQRVTHLDGLVAVVAVGAICWLPVLHNGAGSVAQWALLTVAIGAFVGLAVVTLLSYRLSEEEVLLVLLGTVLVGGGLSLSLSLSPLFVNAVVGAVIANRASEPARQSLQAVLLRGDRAVYVVFLLLAGAQWHLHDVGVVLLAVLYTGVRVGGKMLGGWMAFWRLLPPPTGRTVGLGLLSHGGLAVAVVVNLQQIVGAQTPVVDIVTSIVLLGVVLSELVSPAVTQRLIRAAR